jgi:hypothetical protein
MTIHMQMEAESGHFTRFQIVLQIQVCALDPEIECILHKHRVFRYINDIMVNRVRVFSVDWLTPRHNMSKCRRIFRVDLSSGGPSLQKWVYIHF